MLGSWGTAIIVTLYVFTFAHPLLAQNCSDLALQTNHTQQILYEYALIAEAAYGQPPSNSCYVEQTSSQISMPDHQQFPLRPEDIESWKNWILERWQSELHPPEEPGKYNGDDGITYVTCAYDLNIPQLALTWTISRQYQENTEIPLIDVIIPEIRPVIPHTMLPVNEEIGIINLRREPSSPNETEELVAIRGTNFTKISQIMTSLRGLLRSSCVFEILAIVVSDIGSRTSASSISVVGHSLGGAAVQYIVLDHDSHPRRNPTNRQNSNVKFTAYSFNAIGLDHEFAEKANTSDLYSYVIDGEIVSRLGEVLGKTQVGTTIRYIPPETWQELGFFSIVNSVLQGEFPERVRRHELSTVQEGLCECINGHGALDIKP